MLEDSLEFAGLVSAGVLAGCGFCGCGLSGSDAEEDGAAEGGAEEGGDEFCAHAATENANTITHSQRAIEVFYCASPARCPISRETTPRGLKL